MHHNKHPVTNNAEGYGCTTH